MWRSAKNPPPDYQEVLLYLPGGPNNFTTGWHVSQGPKWIGVSLNQAPPVYELQYEFVKYWQPIKPPNTRLQPTSRQSISEEDKGFLENMPLDPDQGG